MTLRRDGVARYEGRYFVKHIGRFEARIRESTFDRLAALAVAGGFFALRSSYFEPITDQPSVITTVVAARQRKTVDNYARSGPPRLEEFERAVDAVARRIRWRPSTALPNGSRPELA